MRRCARREIDQIISLNRGREFVSNLPVPPLHPRVNLGARRSLSRTWYFFNPAIELLRRFPSRPLHPPLLLPCVPRARRVYFANISGGDAANRLIMWAFERALYFFSFFCACRAQEESLSRKSFAEFRKLSGGQTSSFLLPFRLSRISMHRLSRELHGTI